MQTMCDMLTNIFNIFSPLVKSLSLLVSQLLQTIFIGFAGSPEEPGETRREAGDDDEDDYERAVVSQSEILTYMFVGFLFVAIGE